MSSNRPAEQHQWGPGPHWALRGAPTVAGAIEAKHYKCDHDWYETPNRIWVCRKCGAQQQR